MHLGQPNAPASRLAVYPPQGVFTMPAMLKFLFLGMDTADLNFTVDIPSLLVMLVITILAPSLLGKV